MKKRIVLMVSGGGTNAQTIIDGCESGAINGVVVGMVSSALKAYALERAKKHGIPVVAIHKSRYENMEACQRARHEAIASFSPDLIVLAGYLGILPPETVARYKNKIVNIHPALLPSFGGQGMYGERVHQAVLARGCKVSGATVHIVDENIDTGEILAQGAVPVLENDTPETLAARVLTIEHDILPKTVAKLCQDEQGGRIS